MKFKNSSIAINWVEPLAQVWAEPSDDSIIPNTFYAQTSVMNVVYNPAQDASTFTIKHRGDEVEYRVSSQALEEPQAIYTIMNFLMKKAGVMWGLSDSVPEKLIQAWLDKVVLNPPPGSGDLLTIKQTDFWGGAFSKKQASMANVQMAAYATGGMIDSSYIPPSAFVPELPGVNESVVHPMRGTEHKLADCIMNLNDEYRWTREKIADWVETLDVDTTFKTVYTNKDGTKEIK